MKICYYKKGNQVTYYEVINMYDTPKSFQVTGKGNPKEMYLENEREKERTKVSRNVINMIYQLPYFEVTKIHFRIHGKEIRYYDRYGLNSLFRYKGNKKSRCPFRMYQYSTETTLFNSGRAYEEKLIREGDFLI